MDTADAPRIIPPERPDTSEYSDRDAAAQPASAAAEIERWVGAGLDPGLELVRPLGAGNHAHVFLARDPALQRLVVVKVLRPELAADQIMRRRFEREAQAAAQLVHTNVPLIYSVGGLADDTPYIVMEYIEGRSLEDAIAALGPLPLDQALPMLRAVAGALAAAHAHDVVHRDVRPGNVLIEATTGRAVLTDFGIAGLLETGSRAVERLTTPGHRLGDPRYMSPEVIRGEPASEQSDVFALGVLAYETLTGRGPFADGSNARLATMQLSQSPASLRALRPDLEAATASAIERCLAKEPNRRPRAAELPALLGDRRAAKSGATAAAPPSPLAAFLADLRHRRVYQVGIAYIAIGIALVEAANNFFPALDVPGWASRAVALVVVLGFPIALTLSWVFDITDSGIRRTRAPQTRRAALVADLLPWAALAASVLCALLVGLWMLTR
jgi:serine/threonine-protein kinase